jgi:predicted nucleotidyltransferase
MNAPLETILTELRQRFTAIFGTRLDKLILYGSQARGDADEESDIDVMVVLKQPFEDRGEDRDRYMDVICDLSLKYNTVVMPFFTDSATYASSDFGIYQNVRREGVTI